MSTDSLVSPKATARFVVTLPPEPSRLAAALRKDIAAAFTALTSTDDAFQRRCKGERWEAPTRSRRLPENVAACAHPDVCLPRS